MREYFHYYGLDAEKLKAAKEDALVTLLSIASANVLRPFEIEVGKDVQVATEAEFKLGAGRPYKSLSAVARAIAGSRWNGWVFFGVRHSGKAG